MFLACCINFCSFPVHFCIPFLLIVSIGGMLKSVMWVRTCNFTCWVPSLQTCPFTLQSFPFLSRSGPFILHSFFPCSFHVARLSLEFPSIGGMLKLVMRVPSPAVAIYLLEHYTLKVFSLLTFPVILQNPDAQTYTNTHLLTCVLTRKRCHTPA